jgi:hypothetical protein
MSDDNTDSMINSLLAQTTVAPQPSFMGLQAPPDPSQVQALLSKLKQQQFSDRYAAAQTGGEYGWLNAPAALSMSAAGQKLGGILNAPGGLSGPGPNQPPQPQAAQGDQSAPQTSQAAISAALMKGRQAYAAMINANVDPDVAQMHTLRLLTSLGVPGADDKLAEAQQTVLKNEQTRQAAAKDAGQNANYSNESANRDARLAWDQQQANYTPRPDLSNSEYIAQQVGGPNGRIVFEKRGDKLPPPPLTQAQDTSRDAIARKIANYDIQLGTAVGRGGGDLRQDYLQRALAINPDFDEKNFKQSSDALKAFGPSGTQGQMILKTQNAMNHLDALKSYGDALQTGDVNVINRASNFLSQQMGGIPITTYEAVAPIVANEVSSGLVKGGGGQEERLERVKALAAQLSGPQRNAAIDGMRSLLGAQYQNNKNLYEKTTLRHDFEDRFPVAGGFPAPPGVQSATQSAAPVRVNSRADALALKPGTSFVTPDGRVLVR